MHIAFLTNPASGEVNVQLATAQQLAIEDHDVTFLSAESCRRKVDYIRMTLPDSKQHLMHFVSLGSGRAVDDFTVEVQGRMSEMRRPPGDPVSLETCIENGLGPVEEHAESALLVRDHLVALDPDMICVDVLTVTFVTGVRLTNRKFILTVPCSPGMTALPGVFEPHPVAANRRGTWRTVLENVYLKLRGHYHTRTHPDCIARRNLLSKRFGLKKFSASREIALIPPYWDDNNCVAGIHYNAPGLTDSHKQPSKLVFVGGGIPSERTDMNFPEISWMDEAMALGEDVVYINMGSMFIWQEHEFRNCLAAFAAVYKAMGGRVRFLFKTNFPVNSHNGFPNVPLPPFVRFTNWIESQHTVYSHPALKVFVHHGGGNSFNEAVYFGVPQLVLSQWLDTHEYAYYAEDFGLGLRSRRPPHVDAADIQDKLLRLLGPQWDTYKTNCKSWAVRTQIAGGKQSAARVILAHALSSAAVQGSSSTLPLSSDTASSLPEKHSGLLEEPLCTGII